MFPRSGDVSIGVHHCVELIDDNTVVNYDCSKLHNSVVLFVTGHVGCEDHKGLICKYAFIEMPSSEESRDVIFN